MLGSALPVEEDMFMLKGWEADSVKSLNVLNHTYSIYTIALKYLRSGEKKPRVRRRLSFEPNPEAVLVERIIKISRL